MSDDDKDIGASARMWLWLLKEGGHHRPRDVAAMTYSDTSTAAQCLGALARSGFLSAKPGAHGSEYGVTLSCKVPQGLTMRQLNAALFERQQESVA